MFMRLHFLNPFMLSKTKTITQLCTTKQLHLRKQQLAQTLPLHVEQQNNRNIKNSKCQIYSHQKPAGGQTTKNPLIKNESQVVLDTTLPHLTHQALYYLQGLNLTLKRDPPIQIPALPLKALSTMAASVEAAESPCRVFTLSSTWCVTWATEDIHTKEVPVGGKQRKAASIVPFLLQRAGPKLDPAITLYFAPSFDGPNCFDALKYPLPPLNHFINSTGRADRPCTHAGSLDLPPPRNLSSKSLHPRQLEGQCLHPGRQLSLPLNAFQKGLHLLCVHF